MKEYIKKIIFICCRFFDGFCDSGTITVLMYHSISDAPGKYTTPTDAFRNHMEYLSGNDIVTLDMAGFLNIVEEGYKIKEKNVLVTFDDGYQDVYTNALPILKKYGIPAVLFFTPRFAGRTADFTSSSKDRKKKILTVDQVKELAKHNVSIANHGWSHKIWSNISKSEKQKEYKKAATWLESNIKENVYPRVFAFPKGRQGREDRLLLAKMKARIAFAGTSTVISKNKQLNSYMIPRFAVLPSWTVEDIKRSFSRCYSWTKNNRKILMVIFSLVLLIILLGGLLLFL